MFAKEHDEIEQITVTRDTTEHELVVNVAPTAAEHTRKSIASFTYFLLCSFALFYLLDPSAPFFVQFLMSEKHFTIETITDSVFPVWSYSYPFIQVLVGLACEIKFIGHKFVVALGLLFNCVTILAIILCNNTNLLWLVQLSEVTFSIQFAAHQAFAGLRYHMVNADKYPLITSLTRGFMLFGHVIGAIVGQVLLMQQVSLYIHFCLGLFATIPCVIISLWFFPLPSEYTNPMNSKHKSIADFFGQIAQCYKSYPVAVWSFISISSTAVHQLVLTYYQALFKVMDPEKTYNGFIIAAAYFIAAIASFIPSKIGPILGKYGKWMAMVTLLIMSFCLLLLGIPNFISLYVAYVVFICYHALYEFLFVSSSAQIAQSLRVTRFAAVFSFNAVVQNLTQLIIQFIIGKNVMHMNTQASYRVFGIISLGVSVSLFVLLVMSKYLKTWLPQSEGTPEHQQQEPEAESH